MSNMDEVLWSLEAFQRVLDTFTDELRISFKELSQSHGNVAPYWDDIMGREYYKHWHLLEKEMRRYHDVVLPGHLEDMQQKIRHVHAYLHG
uniref:Uncharacterized protein n=1 Tax=Candidatus Kentrum sp. LPFa TaxID=2126335 RepID=A0A450WDR9_9GAMM|nr:MAG: hypothetical protein BECKLPF1236B_GA0070989_10726 [Candidatus Kentron sp. LPFa]